MSDNEQSIRNSVLALEAHYCVATFFSFSSSSNSYLYRRICYYELEKNSYKIIEERGNLFLLFTTFLGNVRGRKINSKDFQRSRRERERDEEGEGKVCGEKEIM